ncbi:dihydrolipoamide dehydrogenase [Ectothiorhodospira magna]|uniref:Dihydrolipoamide dehydrogenase n=1 Tax=Ectothiorhodospira magna TaxID=867345 RepID=A0A1H9FQA9_9GAMM|nr:dihydrolipoyl dehydrogenase [Ectothiorhodospira magna]SEQ39598.1 dihydrolipoamide dehydrogenase [Ectothiorhodospira magna]
MTTNFDVIIIGAGSAGLAAVREVRKQTERFLLINDGPYGTTCARVGCMPSKALIEAANAYHARNKAERFGIRGSEHLSIDVAVVLQRVRALRDRFVGRVLKATDAMGVRSIAGRARLLSPRQVAVGDDILETRSIIIATGSRPVVPTAWQALGERLLTTDTFFEQETLPGRMAVIGLGAIGVEMAQALSRLGVDVHAFGKGERIAGVSDPAVAKAVRKALEDEFSIHTGHEVGLCATADGVRVQAGPVDIEVDRVLVAVGRKPNLDDLGIETLGVSLDKRGLPPFDRNSLQIADLPVFIAGDANADASLLHEAADEGYIAGVNALASEPTRFCRRTPLAIVFSDPGIASVGQRFSDLNEAQCLIGSIDFGSQGRALTAQRNQGLMRVYASADDGRLLGAEICAPAAEHMAHLLALAVERRLAVHDFLAMPFYHPVLEEGLRSALREIAGKLSHRRPDLSACEAYQAEALD